MCEKGEAELLSWPREDQASSWTFERNSIVHQTEGKI